MTISRTFIDFFLDRGHVPTTGSTLIPRLGDPVLFTTSGMHPLTPYLEGDPIRWGADRGHAAMPANHRSRRGRGPKPT